MGDETVLVLAPLGRDAALTVDLLTQRGFVAVACADATELCGRMPGAGMALVAEEALPSEAIEDIAAALAVQPPWSDFPIAVIAAQGGSDPWGPARWEPLGNVSLLDRPLHISTMLAAVNGGLRARRRQYDARRAIESREQFVAMLGHELRNPLAAIRLASNLVARSGTLDDMRRHAAAIDRQGRHLGRLVDDLLDVARLTYGKVTLQLEAVDLAEILAFTAESLDEAFRAAGVEFRANVEAGLTVRGDRVRLEQVFTNLLNNAAKYTQAGGSVRLDARVANGRAVVRVVDSGIGIDTEMVPRVFDLFAQADSTLDRSHGGLGIGLTVVRSLVALHGGEVTARSDGLGKGTEFRVELPLQSAPSREVLTIAGPEPRRSGAVRVVLVEDGEDLRDLMHALLVDEGHTVWTASDGPHGVESILEVEPDIAFVDIGLPVFDGYEVARRVRASGAKVPLVALTGYGQQEDRRQAVAAGFDAHIAKPVDIDRIDAVIADLAGG
jgi:signal transduction histidine kinase